MIVKKISSVTKSFVLIVPHSLQVFVVYAKLTLMTLHYDGKRADLAFKSPNMVLKYAIFILDRSRHLKLWNKNNSVIFTKKACQLVGRSGVLNTVSFAGFENNMKECNSK